MQAIIDAVAEAGFRNSVLFILLGVIFAFLVLTVALSGYAVVLRERHAARERRRARLAERWQEPLLLAVADPEGGADFSTLVDQKNRLRFVGFVLEYARRVRGDERLVLRRLALPYLELVAERASSPKEEVRARAVQTLGTLGQPDYALRVVEALDDRSPLVAMVAARALAREETPEHAPAVLARLEQFKAWDRRFLASMLAAMGSDVADTLRHGLGDPVAAPWTRAVLAEACTLQGDFEAADTAARVLEESDDRELRASALRLLAGVGRPEHAPIVRKLCRSEDPVLRAQALRALGTVGNSDDVPFLMGAMYDAFAWGALHAARAAKSSGGADALVRLAETSDARAILARQVLAEDSRA